MVNLLRCCVALLVALLALVIVQPSSLALTRIESLHGAWAIRCTLGSGAPKVCGVTNRNRAFMDRVRVQLLVVKGRRRGGAVVRLSAPASINRDTGVSLIVDKKVVGVLPFVDCDKEGCVAQTALSSKAFTQFWTGREVTVSMQSGSGYPFRMSVPLRGFSEAYDQLP